MTIEKLAAIYDNLSLKYAGVEKHILEARNAERYFIIFDKLNSILQKYDFSAEDYIEFQFKIFPSYSKSVTKGRKHPLPNMLITEWAIFRYRNK